MSEWTLQRAEIEPLLEGLAILSTGGGGNPDWGRQILENEFRQGRTVRVIDPQALPDDAQTASGGIMGSVAADCNAWTHTAVRRLTGDFSGDIITMKAQPNTAPLWVGALSLSKG